MHTLTEQMVKAQTMESNLSYVTQFKCWGQNLRDVSIVTRLCNVEVLMFSLNEITTMEPFAHCKKLKELYLRENMITDINELNYLKNLPQLKVLWLEGNPCCELVGDNYRKIVLSTLPHLEKLDNVEVSLHEVEAALHCRMEVDLSTQDMAPQFKSRWDSNVQLETTRNPGGEERPIMPAKYGNSSYQLDYSYSKPNQDSQATLSQWSQQNELRECTSNYRSNLSVQEERTGCSANKDRREGSTQNVNSTYQDDYPTYSKPNHDSQATGFSDTSLCNDMPERCPFGYEDASKGDIWQKMGKRSRGDNSQSNVVSAMIILLDELDSDSLRVLDQEVRYHIRMKEKQ